MEKSYVVDDKISLGEVRHRVQVEALKYLDYKEKHMLSRNSGHISKLQIMIKPSSKRSQV